MPERQTVHIHPPTGTTFGGLTDGTCIDTARAPIAVKLEAELMFNCEDPVLLSLQFPTPLISRVLLSGPVEIKQIDNIPTW